MHKSCSKKTGKHLQIFILFLNRDAKKKIQKTSNCFRKHTATASVLLELPGCFRTGKGSEPFPPPLRILDRRSAVATAIHRCSAESTQAQKGGHIFHIFADHSYRKTRLAAFCILHFFFLNRVFFSPVFTDWLRPTRTVRRS